MHQMQITKVNRPMETVKLATPTGISERGQQDKAHGSRSQFCSVLGTFSPHHPSCGQQERIHGTREWWLGIDNILAEASIIAFLSPSSLILPNDTPGSISQSRSPIQGDHCNIISIYKLIPSNNLLVGVLFTTYNEAKLMQIYPSNCDPQDIKTDLSSLPHNIRILHIYPLKTAFVASQSLLTIALYCKVLLVL